MSDPLNSSNEEGSIRRVTRSRVKDEVSPTNSIAAAASADPPNASAKAKRISTEDGLAINPAITNSPRRIRTRRMSTDEHEVRAETPPIRALRNRRVSLDRESATGTPSKLVEDSSENDSSKPLLRRSRRISVDRETATSTPKRMAPVLEAVAENAEPEKQENDAKSSEISAPLPIPEEKLIVPAQGSPSIKNRLGTMLGNFIDKIPLKRHSFSLNSDNDSDAGKSPARSQSDLNKTLDKNFKQLTGSEKENKTASLSPQKKLRVSDVKEEVEEDDDLPVLNATKSHLDQFKDRAPKVRHSMASQDTVSNDEGDEEKPKKSPKKSLNKTLDKNFKASAVDDDDDKLSVGSLSLDDERSSEQETPKKKKSHLSVFADQLPKSRHSIGGELNDEKEAKSANKKKAANLNKSLDKDFKPIGKNDNKLDEEEPMEVDASSDSSDDEQEEEEAVTDKSLNKSASKSQSPNKSLSGSPKIAPVVNVSPRKSLQKFRQENEGTDQSEEEQKVSPKKDLSREILERAIVEKIQEQIEEEPEQHSSDEGEDDDSEVDEDEDDDSDASGSVMKFEMDGGEVVGGSDDSADNEDQPGEDDEEEEEDVVINTKKLKTSEPPTKVSDILNKCQDFLVTKKMEKKELRTVDEEKRLRMKERKEAKRARKEIERQRREEMVAKQEAQKQLIDVKNQEILLQKRDTVVKGAKKKASEAVAQPDVQKKKKEKKNKSEVKEIVKESQEAVKVVPQQNGGKQKKEKKGKLPEEKSTAIVDKKTIKTLDNIFASNIEKPSKVKAGQDNDPPKKSQKKKLKILQTETPAKIAEQLQKPKEKKRKRAAVGQEDEPEEDDYVPKKRLELIPDKKYHQLAKQQREEAARLKDALKRKDGKPLKAVVKEPLRVLPKPVWTASGEFQVVEDDGAVNFNKKARTVGRTNGTEFEVELLTSPATGNLSGKGNFKEQFQNRKNIRREDSHNLLKRRKFY